MAFIPVIFIAGFVNVQATTQTLNDKGKYSEEEGGRIATETVENIKTVVSLGREFYFYNLFISTFNRKFKRTLFLVHIRGIFYGISTSVLFFIQAASFSYGFYLIMNDDLSVPSIYR